MPVLEAVVGGDGLQVVRKSSLRKS
jgi:hypothetical protein